MWFLGSILLCCTFSLISCETCIREVLKCSPLRASLASHRRLPETSELLDLTCRHQDRFMNCIAEAAKSCYVRPSTLEMYILSNRMFLLDLCAYTSESTSRWQMKYLENVPCINKQDFRECTSSVIVADRNLTDTSTKCLIRDKLTTCIFKKILEICGEDAAALSRHLLNLETDDFTCATVGNQTEDVQTELEPSYLLKHRIGFDSGHERQYPESLDKKLQFKNDIMDVEESSSSLTNFVRQTDKIHSTLVSNISKGTKAHCDYIHDENSHCEADGHKFEEVSKTSSVSRNVGEENIDKPRQRSTSGFSDVNREEYYGIETSQGNTQGDMSIKPELDHYLQFSDCEKSEAACVTNRELQHNALNQIKDFKGHVRNPSEATDNQEELSGMDVTKILTDRDLNQTEISPVFWVDIGFNQTKYLCTLATLANQTTYALCADVLGDDYNTEYSSLYLERNQQVEHATTVEPNILHTEEKSGLKNVDSMHIEEYCNSKNENYEESLNITEFLRKIRDHHDASKIQIKSHVHSGNGEETNAKSEITGPEIPVSETVTAGAEELHATSPETFLGRYLQDDYIDSEDAMENSHLIEFEKLSDLVIERYKDLEIPVLDLSYKFAIRSMPIVEKIMNPELNIKAFQYSDRTVNVYWEHPFTPPFKMLACGKADVAEQYNGKSFTCTITLV